MVPPIDISKFEQLKASGDLPSPKGVALAIMRLSQDDTVSMGELARIIKTDPAFVGRLIKSANGSVGFGRRPIAAVQDALTVLGLPAVRNLALGFSLLSNYRSGSCSGFDYGKFWSASLVMAVSMQELTQRVRIAAPEETYCLGLLARVGELALATLYAREYTDVLTQAGGIEGRALMRLEQQAFAMNHAELGCAMLADWGMPKIFTEPVFYLDGDELPFPEGSREYSLSLALRIARRLAGICLAPDEERSAMLPGLLMLGSRLDFDHETMLNISDRVAAEWVSWGALLSLETETVPPFKSIAAREQTGATAALPLPQLESAPPAPAEGCFRVLVVDADPVARDALSTQLGALGHQVFCAGDGHAGLEAALELQPHVLLLDWHLTDMDGAELVRGLRATRAGRGIYLLALVMDERQATQVEELEHGVDDVLAKPVGARLLAARLRAAERVVRLHEEIERDRQEIRHFAAELAVSNRRLQEAALSDSLTGFPNRRYFMERLQQEWAASSRNRRPLVCIAIDIDRFKAVNDSYGHDIGDALLKRVAAAIKQGMRRQDVVARTGGDEFLVLCPDTSLEAGMQVAERVRAAVAQVQVTIGGNTGAAPLCPSASLGVAVRDAVMAEPEALLKRADQALYLAKQQGRNRVGIMQ